MTYFQVDIKKALIVSDTRKLINRYFKIILNKLHLLFIGLCDYSLREVTKILLVYFTFPPGMAQEKKKKTKLEGIIYIC